jgi:hypothetical protein
MRQHPLATEFAVKKRVLTVFFRVSPVIPNAELSADAIKMSNTAFFLLLQCARVSSTIPRQGFLLSPAHEEQVSAQTRSRLISQRENVRKDTLH